jgi:hypothetical protein
VTARQNPHFMRVSENARGLKRSDAAKILSTCALEDYSPVRHVRIEWQVTKQ